DSGSIPRSKLGEPADGDHNVEQRHALPVLKRLGLHGLTDHSDLLSHLSDEALHDHGDDRRAYELPEHGLDVSSELSGRLAGRLQILDERRGYPAVRTDLHARREIGLIPYEDLQTVRRTYEVVGSIRHLAADIRRHQAVVAHAPGKHERNREQSGRERSN